LAQQNSDKQFEELLIPLMDGLYRLACRLERDSDRAQDLLQDSLLKGFRSFQKLQIPTSFRPWMGRILYRTFLDRHRGDKVEISIEEESDLGAPWESDSPSPSLDLRSLFLARSTSREINAALDRLPVDQAVAVFMVDVEDYRYAEAAEALGVSPGTVASRVARGRRALGASLHRLARERGWIKP
jgi:RNA polymerase sigma-70 factor (ECF subfamily)